MPDAQCNPRHLDIAARWLIAAVLALCLVGAAIAQTAGQLTEPTYQPPERRLTGALVFSGAPGLAAPKGADKLSIQLASVSVASPPPGTEALVQGLIARLTGHRIAVSEIFAAAADLEAAFAKKGYILSRVVIPAQTLVDGGSLRLSVINGFVEAIDDSAVPPALRPRLSLLTAPLIGQRGLLLSDLERRLLLAGDTYGVALGSALAAGATPGGTVIVLDPAYRRITGFAGLDNSFSEALGKYNLSSGFELNGLLGQGEVIYGRLSGNPRLGGNGLFSEHPRLRTVALGAVVPIGSDGLTFGLEGTDSRTTPKAAGVGSTSRFDRLSARLYYPWLRSSRANVSAQLSFDINRDRLDLLAPTGTIGLYEDRTRVLRFSADGFWIREGGAILEAGAVASVGLDALGARGRNDASALLPLSRDGADAAFRKLEASARYRHPFGKDFSLSVAGRAQTSFGDPLVSSEQFGIATLQDLSPFDQGVLSGDSGWIMRSELSRQYHNTAFGKPLLVSPYVFGAMGEVNRERPSVGEAGRVRASAFGLGVELISIQDPKFSSGSLRIEYGKGYRDDDGKDASRLSILGSYRF